MVGPRNAPAEASEDEARTWLLSNGLLPEGDLPVPQLLHRHLALAGAAFGP